MKITIDIVNPPEGYSVPERKPVYLPFGNIIILIGECWVRASDRLKYGGESHICCDKIKGE
jgi:hypothetical protein